MINHRKSWENFTCTGRGGGTLPCSPKQLFGEINASFGWLNTKVRIYNATCGGAAAELGENVYFTECVELLPWSTASFGSCNPAFGAEIMVFLCTSCHVSCPGTEPWRIAMLIPLSSGESDSKGCSSGSTAGFSRTDTRTVSRGAQEELPPQTPALAAAAPT